jgi:hypothetical protein
MCQQAPCPARFDIFCPGPRSFHLHGFGPWASWSHVHFIALLVPSFVDPAADPAASSRDLFFPPAVFKLLDGEGFILQVHRVFTRIRSGATVVASGGGALGSTISTGTAACTGGGFFARSNWNGCKCGV